ncbi:hypothetical protein [Sphingobacterium prati]|uniref:hypothetical protein n=1 Tax=Sphingobacterium prati TaxID=2737006 RepID=UPI001554FE48|nr:hypothetical protein [Sphingobacterium prati]NPE47839.1 hypothetical protein [Sphingobacterium prati]
MTLAILLVTSCAALFFNWQIGLAGLAFSNAELWFAKKFGNILNLQTVGQLAKKMTSESYSNLDATRALLIKAKLKKYWLIYSVMI